MDGFSRCVRVSALPLMIAMLFAASHASAVPVEYRISGLLSGTQLNFFDFVEVTEAPFEIRIEGDTDGAFDFGNLSGIGSA